MAKRLRSVGTAVLLGVAILVLSVEVIAPRLPPYVGPPDLRASRTFTFPAAVRVRLVNADGSVRIRTHDAPDSGEITVEAGIKLYSLGGSGTAGDLERYVDSLIAIESRPHELSITTEPLERPEAIALQVQYAIDVPRGTNIVIDGTNGNVWVAEGCGEVVVQSGNADIEILRPRGMVIARSTNGRIRVVDAARSATLETVNGNIHADLRQGVLDASSTNGSIETRVLDAGVKGCVLNSQNGGIKIVLGEDVSFSVNARAQRGAIHTDFTIDGQRGPLDRNQLRGTVGAGGTKLNLNTASGSIWLTRG